MRPTIVGLPVLAGSGSAENIQAEHPETIERLTALLKHDVAKGRSTPLRRLKNDVDARLTRIASF